THLSESCLPCVVDGVDVAILPIVDGLPSCACISKFLGCEFTRACNLLHCGGPHNLPKLVLRQHVSKLLQEPGLAHLNEFPHGHSVSNATGSVDHCVYRVHYILHIKTRSVGVSCVLKPFPTNALSGASSGQVHTVHELLPLLSFDIRPHPIFTTFLSQFPGPLLCRLEISTNSDGPLIRLSVRATFSTDNEILSVVLDREVSGAIVQHI